MKAVNGESRHVHYSETGMDTHLKRSPPQEEVKAFIERVFGGEITLDSRMGNEFEDTLKQTPKNEDKGLVGTLFSSLSGLWGGKKATVPLPL